MVFGLASAVAWSAANRLMNENRGVPLAKSWFSCFMPRERRTRKLSREECRTSTVDLRGRQARATHAGCHPSQEQCPGSFLATVLGKTRQSYLLAARRITTGFDAACPGTGGCHRLDPERHALGAMLRTKSCQPVFRSLRVLLTGEWHAADGLACGKARLSVVGPPHASGHTRPARCEGK